MTACPFKFKQNTETPVGTLSFNYSFDIIKSITTVLPINELNEGISINQSPKIPAIIINLGGRTSNANMAIAINGKTTLFNLYDAYITKNFPILKTDNNYSFVIEGFSTDNISGEKILIFIPLNSLSNTTNKTTSNPFSIMLEALVTQSSPPSINDIANDVNADLNKLIPSEPFYYYTYMDSSQVLYNIVAYDTSNLKYDSTFGDLLASALDNTPKYKQYTSEIGTKDSALNSTALYISTSPAVNQDAISNSFEDNIYIDCQPTDNLNNGDNYLQTTVKEAVGLIKQLEISFPYLLFIICLTLIVIAIFSISFIFKKTFVAPKEIKT